MRVFLSVCVHLGLCIKQADVETAFLNGKLKEEIFIQAPEGYKRANTVLRLQKALYGLPEAPRCWYDKLKEVLIKLEFRSCAVESCIFVLKKGSKLIMIIIYVDDMLIASNKEEYVLELITELNKFFNVQVMEHVNSFIGLNINVIDQDLEIDQTKYLESRTKEVELAKPIKTPMEEKLKLEDLNGMDKSLCIKKFQKLLGSLNYVMERTRPDVNFAINLLSRYTNQATDELYKYLMRVQKYLWSTRNLKLRYVADCDIPIDAYCDASWASGNDSKSTSGYVIRVFGNLVQFKTKKQSMVAISSTESEYIALSECCREVLVVRNILKEIGVLVEGACKVKCDNQPTIIIGEGEGKANRTKHIRLKYHHIKDLVEKGLVQLEYVPSNENLADFLTKSVSEAKIKFSLTNLGFI